MCLISNLKDILTKETEGIKELTDFEPGLRFAIHRQLDLKQLELNYFCNPWYIPKNGYSSSSIDSEIRSLVDQLLALE